MGKRTDYDLRGWGPNGRFLSAFEKEEIQDLVFDEGMDDYGCSSRDNEPEIMSFGSEYYGAYCPCKLEKKPDNKCSCRDFREGQGCDCGQYIELPEDDAGC